MEMVNEGLASAGRTLIIDEADYAVDRGMIEVIRDMHDRSGMPVVLIGMELLPQKIRKWPLVDGRILTWTQAPPIDLRDARMLAEHYAPGIEIDDALIELVMTQNAGDARKMTTDFAHVLEQSALQGTTTMTLDKWGKAPFLRGEAPKPRSEYL